MNMEYILTYKQILKIDSPNNGNNDILTLDKEITINITKDKML